MGHLGSTALPPPPVDALPGTTHGSGGTGATLDCVTTRARAPSTMLTYNSSTPKNFPPTTITSPIPTHPTLQLLTQPPTPHFPSTAEYLDFNLPSHSPAATMSPTRGLSSGPGLTGTAGIDSPAISAGGSSPAKSDDGA